MARKAYIGVQTSHTYTNMLGGIGDMETGTVYKTTAEAAYLKNSSQHKFGSSSQAFQQSGSATELTYTLRNSSGQMSFALDNTHTYYFSVWIRQNTSLDLSFDWYWPIAEPSVMSGVKNTDLNTWEHHSAVVSRSGFTSGSYPMRIDCNNYPGNNALMYVDGLMVIDLTATYGAGNEPTKEFCDQYFAFTTGTNTVTIPTAREIKKMYIGVGGVARKVKKGYIGVNGVAKQFYASTLPPAVLDLWGGINSNNYISCITYADGYWVVCGRYYNGSTCYARIAYATSLNGTWTTKDLWSGTSTSNCINSVFYADGYWVVGGRYYNGSTYYARIAYATSLSGTWTTNDLWGNTNNANTINCITYANGYWVVGGNYANNRARIAYATSPSGTWTTKDVWANTNSIINSVFYADGYWVVGGRYYSSDTRYARIAYATSPSGTWTTKDVWTSAYGDGYINSVFYADGYWVVGGLYRGTYTSGTYYARIAYATSPSGTWTTKDLWSGTNNSSNYINSVFYADGYWVVGGRYYSSSNYYARIAYATSLNGTWTTKDVWNRTNNNSNYINSVFYADGYWVVGGQYYNGSNSSARIAYATTLDELGTNG